MSFHKQTAEFLAKLNQSLPPMSNDIMQGWIENPRALRMFLEGLCPPVPDVPSPPPEPISLASWLRYVPGHFLNPERLPSLITISERLSLNPEILSLGKIWHTLDLCQLIDQINDKLVKPGEFTWRLPTLEELCGSYGQRDGKFGYWMVWSGTIDQTTPKCLFVFQMDNGERFGERDGSQVSAYLVKDTIKQ